MPNLLPPFGLAGPPGPGGEGGGFVPEPSTTPPPVVPGVPVVLPANGAPDLVTQGVSRLIQQYRDKPKIVATVKMLMYLVQDLANAITQVPLLDDFDQTMGVHLDALAEIVGQSRVYYQGYSASDSLLRMLSRMRIVRNYSKGTPEDIILAISKLVSPSTQIQFYSFGSMSCEVELNLQPTDDQIRTLKADVIPRPAAVDLQIAWYLPARYLGWDDDPSGFGLSEIGDDTTGGYMAELI